MDKVKTFGILIVIIAILATTYLVGRQQELRKRAQEVIPLPGPSRLEFVDSRGLVLSTPVQTTNRRIGVRLTLGSGVVPTQVPTTTPTPTGPVGVTATPSPTGQQPTAAPTATLTPPTVTLTVDKTTVHPGETIRVSWTGVSPTSSTDTGWVLIGINLITTKYLANCQNTTASPPASPPPSSGHCDFVIPANQTPITSYFILFHSPTSLHIVARSPNFTVQ